MSELDLQSVQFLFRPDECPKDKDAPFVWVIDLDTCRTAITAMSAASPRPDLPIAGPRRDVCRNLVTSLIAGYTGISPRDLVLDTDVHGRLAVGAGSPRPPAANGIDFNLSHCENICGFGICRNGRIGVDVEILRLGDKLSAVWQYLSRPERARVESLPPDDRPMELYKCWTAKEAFVKAVGLGLSFGLDQVETATTGKSLRLARIKGSTQLARGWNLVHRIIDIADAEVIVAVVFGR